MNRDLSKGFDAQRQRDFISRSSAAWMEAGRTFWGRLYEAAESGWSDVADAIAGGDPGYAARRYASALGDAAWAFPLALREFDRVRREPAGDPLLFRAYAKPPATPDPSADMPVLPAMPPRPSTPSVAVPAADADVFHKVFSQFGITLGATLTIEADSTCWLLRDGARTYRIVPQEGPDSTSKCEVYGPVRGQDYTITANGTTKAVKLPAQVRKASQGMAFYTVPKNSVQPFLPPSFDRDFKLWSLGGQSTPVVVFLVHYQESDLGEYYELGLACFVAPRRNALAVGMHVLSLAVDKPFTCEAGLRIWGYPKVVRTLAMDAAPESVACTLQLPQANGTPKDILRLKVPRGGDWRSRALPLDGYTVKQGQVNRVVFTRSGDNETWFSGREMAPVEVLDASAGSGIDIADQIAKLGIAGQKPRFTTWTELMSGQFGVPEVLPAPVA